LFLRNITGEERGYKYFGDKLLQNSSIKELDLSSNKLIDDEVIKILNGLEGKTLLKSLNLSNNSLTV
jgi:hypothetical protein